MIANKKWPDKQFPIFRKIKNQHFLISTIAVLHNCIKLFLFWNVQNVFKFCDRVSNCAKTSHLYFMSFSELDVFESLRILQSRKFIEDMVFYCLCSFHVSLRIFKTKKSQKVQKIYVYEKPSTSAKFFKIDYR